MTLSSQTLKAPINWTAAITLLGTPILSMIAIPLYAYHHDFSFSAWISLFFLLAFSSLSITAGYHRLWAHRSYEASLPLKIILMIGGTFAIQNSILYWASGHRTHHRHVDDVEKDPYSIKKGFWYAHLGWMIRDYPAAEANYKNAPDLMNDKLVMFQHKYYVPLVIAVHSIILLSVGWAIGDVWGVILLGGLLRLVLSHHVTFFINSLCHMFGKRPYTDENTARDNFWLAIATWGEGYHNYHHIFQYDYRNGVKWWQYDPTKWLIWTCSRFGLARNLRRIPSLNIKKAELAMKFKYAEQDLAIYGHHVSEDFHNMKHRIAQEYEAFTHTLNDMAKLKEQEMLAKKQRMTEKLHQMDDKLKLEFQLIEQRLQHHRARLEIMVKSLPKATPPSAT
ncbi:acyl-CoA desaturase [Acinetobacter nectaris]|uniref:acyl-CoA desaturase n=1 Tax=Acinetobacter nectaris TaxID=1219382 RepID=UPI001F2A1011|nr:acyl-CoA desaturase [Acinetobacter nectaris]MCF8998497.1 acyl-CoA desaturase [Acinetobacter nectaris]MCF9027615.1 acyl-CoA desaturase [Acinetobacter nectaris]